MKIKKIEPPRVFFPSKTSKVKDTLHVSTKSGDKVILNIVYGFLGDILKEEYNNIYICNNVEKKKPFKKKKRKKIIVMDSSSN